MGRFRCFWISVALTLAGGGGEAFAAKKKPASRESPGAVRPKPVAPTVLPDTGEAAWRKRLPWLYRDTTLAVYRDSLLLPLFRRYGLGHGNLFRRGGFVEAVLPRGRPMHEYAYEIESLCAAAGIQVAEGWEFDSPSERVEYSLQAPGMAPLALKLTRGKSVLPGAARMALVVVALDSLTAEGAERLHAFPVPLTLAVAAGDSAPASALLVHPPAGGEILLDLPMEPAGYPYVKPGPGAVFIHHSRAEVEALLKAKLKTRPSAAGFATTLGDRAIENRPLMENVLRFAAARSLIFLDLTTSPRGLTASTALQTGAVAYSARAQAPDSPERLEAELLRRCERAAKTGEGIWVLRYFPALPDLLERLLDKNRAGFEEMGLEWAALSSLRGPGRAAAAK